MSKNYDESVEINDNPNWPYILDHPCRILIIGGLRSDRTNVLLNVIKYQLLDIAKLIYMLKIHSNKRLSCLLTEQKK